MRAPIRFPPGASLLVALTLSLCGTAIADVPETHTAPEPDRLHLAASHIEPAPQQSGRYSLRARFQREESAGVLREGGEFVLLGRFAKAGVSCDANTVFRNGFEN